MAAIAGLFEFCVRLAQFARHQQFFEGVLRISARTARQNGKQEHPGAVEAPLALSHDVSQYQ
jgi:hypothetical protein